MWDTIQFILVISAYILVSYFSIKLIDKWTLSLNIYFRLLILSFCYALFWGIGLFFTGGDPGFAFPAPNIIAIGLMGYNGFYRGILTGLSVLGIWWTMFFVFVFVKNWKDRKKIILKK